jgi:hypothetical protein
MKIYLDMDGVLANFNKKYEEVFQIDPALVEKHSYESAKNFEDFIFGFRFTELQYMPNAHRLLDFVDGLGVDIEILSSSGGAKHHTEVEYQKKIWLNSKLLHYPVNIVPGGSKKAAFSAPDRVLIDDTPRVVDKFRAAGGLAILHDDNNIDHTFYELTRIFGQ